MSADVVRSVDLGREEWVRFTPVGTAGPRGNVRMVRIELFSPAVGCVGINVDLEDLAHALRPFDLLLQLVGEAIQQSGDDTVWMS